MSTSPTLLLGYAGETSAELARRLERLGYVVGAVTHTTDGAVALAAQRKFDLLVVDLNLEGELDAVAAAARISQEHQSPVVFLADGISSARLEAARLAEPYGFVFRPESDHELKLGLETARARLQAERWLGICEKRWLVALRSIGDGVILTDADGRVTLMNPVAEQMTGWKESEARQRPVKDIFHVINEQTRQPIANPLEPALRQGVVVGLTNHTILLRRDGWEVHIDNCIAPVRDERGAVHGAVLVFHDVTERRRQEREIRRLNGLYATLSRLNHNVRRLRSNGELFQMACEICAANEQFPLVWIAWLNPMEQVLRPVARAGVDTAWLDHATEDLAQPAPPHGEGLLRQALRLAQPCVTQVFIEPLWQEAAARIGFRAAGAFPIRVGGVVRGLLVVHTREYEFFRLKEIRLIGEISGDLSYALDFREAEARRREAEARMAEQLKELQRWHAATMGREGRVLELKREVNELLRETGRPIRYASVEAPSRTLLPQTEAAKPDSLK